jgi:hypothetical protein
VRRLRREEEAETVVKPVDGEDDRDPERPDDLDADLNSDTAHDLGASDVERRLDREQ